MVIGISIIGLFVIILVNNFRINNLKKRIKSIEKINDEALRARKDLIDEIKNEVHEFNSKLKTTGD